MGERAEIRNPKYKKTLLKKDKIQEVNNNPGVTEPTHTPSFLENLVTKGKEKVVQTAKKAVCTVVEQTVPVISETADKVSELKDTLIDRIKPSGDPKDPPADGIAGSTQPNWETLILEEIESKSSYFSSLLNLTDALISSEQFSQKDAEQLVQKWEYAFRIGECVGISHKLAELRHGQDAKTQLAGIMQFFHYQGIKKLDVQNPVAVSPENRFYFDNGTQFPDGTVCEVARWPWLYKGKVYYRGMLCQLEDEQML